MKKIKAGFLVLLVLAQVIAYGQNNINSPYSRFGLGELHGKVNSVRLFGMGGISYGMADPLLVNPSNPASYAVYDSASFLLETGINAYLINLRNTEASSNASYITLSHFAFGFPVTRWWKTSIGVLPYSKIGYNVKLTVEVDAFSNIVNELKGEGGLNQIYWGNGFKLGKQLRVGVNAIYVFGQERHSSLIYFPDSAYILGTKTLNKTRGTDFVFDWGAQYDIKINEKSHFTVGAVYSNQVKFTAKRAYLSEVLTGGHDEIVEDIKDTLAYSPEQKGYFIVPQKLGVGVSYVSKGRWSLGADYEWQNWKNFEYFGRQDSLQNAWKVAVGAEYSPKHTSISKLYKRMSYRMGFHYRQTYINLRNHSIDVFGISFGTKFPVRRSKTTINLGFELGQRGTLQDGLLKENYFKFVFGVNILENWFYKRKYQ